MRLSVEDSEDEMPLFVEAGEDGLVDDSEQHHKGPAQGEASVSLGSDAEFINGDLPEEHYKPRPSRSRSSQIPSTDWTVTPDDKASKKRKRRTLTDTDGSSRTDSLDEDLLRQAKVARGDDSSATKTSSSALKPPSEASTIPFTQDFYPLSMVSDNVQAPTPQRVEVQVVIPPPPDHVFATPNRPASATKKGPKHSKRSHTTIFEDHVGLDDRPDPSPDLHQQQATRKRGRGRPKKTQPEEVIEEEVVVVEAVPAPSQQQQDDDENLLLSPVAPANRRGRPPKAKTQAPPPSTEEAEKENALQEEPVEPEKRVCTPPPRLGSTLDAEAQVDEQEVPRSETPRVVHSPIKKSGGTRFRVGLSRRQRIQPLLRVLKR